MIRQLRPFYTPDELAEVYAAPYDHTKWEDHKIRVRATVNLGRWLRDYVGATSAADLSCGDGAILRGLEIPHSTYGDIVPAPHLSTVGPIADTLDELGDVDLFVCSETLEHVEDPVALLRRIRTRTRSLLLSTPVGEEGDGNPEHYWGWDASDIERLLTVAGFDPLVCTFLDAGVHGGYVHQIWGCV